MTKLKNTTVRPEDHAAIRLLAAKYRIKAFEMVQALVQSWGLLKSDGRTRLVNKVRNNGGSKCRSQKNK